MALLTRWLGVNARFWGHTVTDAVAALANANVRTPNGYTQITGLTRAYQLGSLESWQVLARDMAVTGQTAVYHDDYTVSVKTLQGRFDATRATAISEKRFTLLLNGGGSARLSDASMPTAQQIYDAANNAGFWSGYPTNTKLYLAIGYGEVEPTELDPTPQTMYFAVHLLGFEDSTPGYTLVPWPKAEFTTATPELILQSNSIHWGETWHAEFVGYINEQRAFYNLPPYLLPTKAVYEQSSFDIAQVHSVNMAATQVFAHNDEAFPEGWRTLDERVVKGGNLSSENILVGRVDGRYDPRIEYNPDGTYDPEDVDDSYTIVNEHTIPSPKEAFLGWWNSGGHRQNMLRNWKSTSVYSFMGYEVGAHPLIIADTEIPRYVWLCNCFSLVEDTVAERTLGVNYQLTGAPILMQAVTYRFDALADVRADHEGVHSIRMGRQHAGDYGARVAVEHVAPIHYGVAASLEGLYGGTVPAKVDHGAEYRIKNTEPVLKDHTLEWSIRFSRTHEAEYETPPKVLSWHSAVYQQYPKLQIDHRARYEAQAVVKTQHVVSYSEPPSARNQHVAEYEPASVLQVWHRGYYSQPQQLQSVHKSLYESIPPVQAQHRAKYEDAWTLLAGHRSGYNLLFPVAKQHQARHELLTYARGDHKAEFDLRTLNQVTTTYRALWAMLAGAPSIVQSIASLTLASGKSVKITDAVVSADEDTYAWQARVRIPAVGDFAQIIEGDLVTLTLGGEAYSLMVTSKSLTRSAPSDMDFQVTASSPSVVHDSPRAQPIDLTVPTPMMAKDIVESVLGVSVNWQIVNWEIPAYRVQFIQTVPMEIARSIVGSAGGVIQTEKNGQITARPRFPVTISQVEAATPDHYMNEVEDLLSLSSEYEFHSGAGRFRIREGESTFGDRLEWVPDEGSTTAGILRVLPSPWRTEFTIDCTDSPNTTVFVLVGEVYRQEEQLVEFKLGQGSVSYPIHSLDSVEWRSDSLGSPVFEQYSNSLTGSTNVNEGYGLALIKYTTRCIEYRVTKGTHDQAQFVMKED